MNDSLDRLLKSLNEKIVSQKVLHGEQVVLPPLAPPQVSLTTQEVIWYQYIPVLLKGVSILFRGTVAANAADLLSMMKGDTSMNPTQINIVTNIIGILLAVLEPVRSYLADQPFNWGTFLACIGGAVIAYFTGKSSKSVLASNPQLKDGQ